jgi:GT2 family glycosyltransferase
VDISIIIVNWNSRVYLEKCIESILAHIGCATYETIVIDSGSFDGCDVMLRENYPFVRFIQSRENLGFAQANNHAFRESIGDSVLFLNPDVELLGPALEPLHGQLMSLQDAGIVGCRLLNSDGTVQSSCIQAMPTILNKVLDSDFLRMTCPKSHLWGMAALFEESVKPREVEAISGACLMVKRTAFEQVGGFSEDYFMYAEDIDLSYKIRKAGYKNYYVPNVSVVHHGGSSSDKGPTAFSAVMMPEATWRFFRKTRGRMYGFGFKLGMLISAVSRLILLALVSPIWLNASRGRRWTSSVHKWVAVLRWSVNRHSLAKRYYRADGQPNP